MTFFDIVGDCERSLVRINFARFLKLFAIDLLRQHDISFQFGPTISFRFIPFDVDAFWCCSAYCQVSWRGWFYNNLLYLDNYSVSGVHDTNVVIIIFYSF